MPIVLGLLLSKQLRIDYSYPGFNRLEVDGYVSSRGLAQFLGEGLPVSSLDFDLPSRIESRLEVDPKFAIILTAGIEGFNYISYPVNPPSITWAAFLSRGWLLLPHLGD